MNDKHLMDEVIYFKKLNAEKFQRIEKLTSENRKLKNIIIDLLLKQEKHK